MVSSALHVAASLSTRHTFLRRATAPALPRLQPRALVRAMTTQQTNLDKSTPEETWKEVLGTEEYRILRKKGTEPAGSGEYNKMKADGEYRCGGCGTPLYTSETKFDSGCGWPAFYAEIPGTVDRHVDVTMGMKRTEITCAKCGGHLGHVFENEGFRTPTDARHCVNSKSLKFQPNGVVASAAGILDAPAVGRSLERTVSTSRVKPAELSQPQVAYEMVQGALVRWSEVGPYGRPPPTCVLLHGILGSRRNLNTFARRVVEGFPSWQVLLVDLRCHGESTQLAQRPARPHSVESAAEDVLKLLGQLKLFPEVLVGHSFGGKVVMSMVEQFGRIGSRLPRPLQVWVLDALPGEVRAGEAERRDHPADLIAALRRVPLPLVSRGALQEQLLQAGFSAHIARWTTTNLRPITPGDPGRGLTWTFDLTGIGEMYASYEATSLWPFLRRPAQGVRVSFVRAEGSNYRWAGGDEQRISALGHDVHLLRQAGHWVAQDNPDGLFEIMAPSFGAQPDLHMQRASMLSPRARSLA